MDKCGTRVCPCLCPPFEKFCCLREAPDETEIPPQHPVFRKDRLLQLTANLEGSRGKPSQRPTRNCMLCSDARRRKHSIEKLEPVE